MKTPYSEGWDAGYFGWPHNNPYDKAWGALGVSASWAEDWERGWHDGAIAADCERAAEDDSRKRDAQEGFDE